MNDKEEPATELQLADLKADIKKLGEGQQKPVKGSMGQVCLLSTFLSGLLVAGIGVYATSTYNARQLDAQSDQRRREIAVVKAQTVEKFFPHLASKNDLTKRAAILTISTLDTELATDLGEFFAKEGGSSALAKLAQSRNKQVAESALAALNAITGNEKVVYVSKNMESPKIEIFVGMTLFAKFEVRLSGGIGKEFAVVSTGVNTDQLVDKFELGSVDSLGNRLLNWEILISGVEPGARYSARSPLHRAAPMSQADHLNTAAYFWMEQRSYLSRSG